MPTLGPTASRHGSHVLQALLDLVERIDVLQLFGAVHLHGGEAALDRAPGGRGGVGRAVAADPRIHADAVAHVAAQQLRHGHAQVLPLMSHSAWSMPASALM